ncbi:MAG TPA: OB-fold nucleic acid binding domain-containing protein [archaeon]|nr:OB-fold nucleic acid binding domain-containing protein [archaeon]
MEAEVERKQTVSVSSHELVQKENTNFKRQVAVKARIVDLVGGSWTQENGFGILETNYGEKVGRARLLATVVGKFVSEDGKYIGLTLDDGTETIRVKMWDNFVLVENIKEGDVVDLIGKVRTYNEEIYIVPEIVYKVENPNLELLRKLEIIKKLRELGVTETAPKGENDDTRKKILEVIGSSKDGVTYNKLMEIKAGKGVVEKIVDDLLSGGLCYEPTPGTIKKI